MNVAGWRMVWVCVGVFFSAGLPAGASVAILVDKKTNTLSVADYKDGVLNPGKQYRVTLGKVKGDKEDENDLKTPEGIYTFTRLLEGKHLARKLGKMAFLMNFPNPFDQLAGRTGNGIMLHATHEPERLKKTQDTEGCIVVENQDIEQLKPFIQLQHTPILIFDALSEEYLKPGQDKRLVTFFENWLQSWKEKALSSYIESYHTDFRSQGKDKRAWERHKTQLAHRYQIIEVEASEIRYLRHPKYSVVFFLQKYRSKLKNGGWGHRSSGTKMLYVAEESDQLKIISEQFHAVP